MTKQKQKDKNKMQRNDKTQGEKLVKNAMSNLKNWSLNN